MMTFSASDIQHFYRHGWVKLDEAFPRDQTLLAQDAIWELMRARGHEVYRDRPETWTKAHIHLQENFQDPRADACVTQRWRVAVEEMVGAGRWRLRDQDLSFGWWPVNFINKNLDAWHVPQKGWHWDGQHFHHHVHAPDQGLLMIVLFSDIEAHAAGATCIVDNSHHIVANYLQRQEPAGVSLHDGVDAVLEGHPYFRLLSGRDEMPVAQRNQYFMEQDHLDPETGAALRVREAHGRAGDIYFLHPFMMHSRSDKLVGDPRFICNWTAPLHEPMQFERADERYSVVERSIRMSLGLEQMPQQ